MCYRPAIYGRHSSTHRAAGAASAADAHGGVRRRRCGCWRHIYLGGIASGANAGRPASGSKRRDAAHYDALPFREPGDPRYIKARESLQQTLKSG